MVVNKKGNKMMNNIPSIKGDKGSEIKKENLKKNQRCVRDHVEGRENQCKKEVNINRMVGGQKVGDGS